MNDSKYQQPISSLARRYTILRIAELVAWALAFSSLLFLAGKAFEIQQGIMLAVAVIVALATFAGGYFLMGLQYSAKEKMVRYLDHSYPELENSTDLLLEGRSGLSLLEQLQREKVFTRLSAIVPQVRIPNRNLIATITAVAFSMLALLFPSNENSTQAANTQAGERSAVKSSVELSRIRELRITITPPAYTGIRPYSLTTPDISVPSGSIVKWVMSAPVAGAEVSMVFTNGDTVVTKEGHEGFYFQSIYRYPAIYQFLTRSGNQQPVLSDLHRIEVIEDRVPEIEVKDFRQFTEINDGKSTAIPFTVSMRDDYALADAYIVATVSKGSGESVRFREEKLAFTTPSTVQGKSIVASRVLDLKQLGLDPGDELYFYVQAVDNRTPSPNYARTETFFISLPDTAEMELMVDESLGADLMPEYFRSQRQIIIDSEKLLSEKKKITVKVFATRSNELGYDQKVLRLRYGQFLGEEFESGMIGGSHEAHEEEHHEEEEGKDSEDDVTKKFGHAHDQEQEHAAEDSHDGHDHEKKPDSESEDPIEDFVHKHDDPEEATFFSQGIRAKLKATLALMWEAELHLRLNDPAKSLPYQYKALKLLKEISNDSRIYVHRTGFDAPPLKEDKRLTGDITELRSIIHQPFTPGNSTATSFKDCIAMISTFENSGKSTLGPAEKEVLGRAGIDLGKIILQQPGRYLETLSLIRKLSSEELGDTPVIHDLQRVREDLYSLVPRSEDSPGKKTRALQEIDKLFLEKLKP